MKFNEIKIIEQFKGILKKEGYKDVDNYYLVIKYDDFMWEKENKIFIFDISYFSKKQWVVKLNKEGTKII